MFSRSSRSQMFFKISVPENFANFTGKNLCQSVFLNSVAALIKKEILAQIFREFYDTFKKSFF